MALDERPECDLVAFGDTAQKVSVPRIQAAHTITVATRDMNGSELGPGPGCPERPWAAPGDQSICR